jgi:hypothetical protein
MTKEEINEINTTCPDNQGTFVQPTMYGYGGFLNYKAFRWLPIDKHKLHLLINIPRTRRL